MALEKLKIAIENKYPQFGRPKEVLFNPTQIQFSRQGQELNEKDGQLIGKNTPAILTLDLFFDTTLKRFPPENVQKYTREIYTLTQTKGNLKRQPLCRLIWGAGDVLLLEGFLMSVTKTLTHFLEDGTPVRATLNCSFQEWQEPQKKRKIQNPIDDPIRIVRRGETLSSIAAEEYNDPSLWREIAKANQMNNPRQLTPGQSLTVPPLPR